MNITLKGVSGLLKIMVKASSPGERERESWRERQKERERERVGERESWREREREFCTCVGAWVRVCCV
jgi:hypothetical protein